MNQRFDSVRGRDFVPRTRLQAPSDAYGRRLQSAQPHTDDFHRRPIRFHSLGSVLLGIMLATSLSCSKTDSDSNRSAAAAKTNVEDNALSPTVDSLTDAYGTFVELNAPAERIVSFAPNLTESIAYLGAQGRLVGRTDFCNYPPTVDTIPSIGTLNSYNYERVLSLHPDLVVIMTFDGTLRAEYDRLRELGLRTFAFDSRTVEGSLDAIDTLGMLIGRYAQARLKTNSLRSTIDSIRTLTEGIHRISTFIVLDKAPLITVAGGFINEIVEIAGGRNIAAGDPLPYPQYSRELLLRRNPDVILVPAASESDDVLSPLLEQYPEWSQLSAVRNGRVYAVPRDLIARPGPRMVEGLLYVYRVLHTSN